MFSLIRSFCRVTKKYNAQNCIMSIGQFEHSKTIDDMAHPKCLPVLGTKLDLMQAGGGTMLHEYIERRHKQLGPIFYEKLGCDTKLVFVSDPALIKTVFLSLEGKYPSHILPDPWVLYEKLYGSKRGLFFMSNEEWLINRRIMNKHLLREGSIKWIEEPVKKSVQKFIRYWKQKVEEGNTKVNLELDLYRLSTDVIISVLAGADSSYQYSKKYDDVLSVLSETVKKIFRTTTKLYGLPLHVCQRLDLKVWKDFKESVDTSLLLAQELVNELLRKGDGNKGLIQKLVNNGVRDETIVRIVTDFIIAAGDTPQLTSDVIQRPWFVADESWINLFKWEAVNVKFNPTAYTSIWSLYLLAQNDTIIQEIRTRDTGYIKHVLKESMRLYPVAPFLTRILPKDCILGEYKLNAHTPIIASIYTSGRDEQHFSKADTFLPYRWDRNDPRRNDLANHMPSASMPFAVGGRSCIGKKMAMLQLSEFLTQTVHNFDFECTNTEKVTAVTSQVLVPSNEIELTLSLSHNSK